MWYDNNPILPTTVLDGIIYRKFGDKYYKLQFSESLDARWFGLLNDTDGWAALTKGVDMAQKLHVPLYIPSGNYSLSKPLMLPNNIEIIGDGTDKTWINNGWTPVEGGIMLKNADSYPSHIKLKNMSFNGALVNQWFDVNSSDPSGYQSSFEFENVNIHNIHEGKGFVCHIPFLVNIFKNVNFYDVASSIELIGGTSNLNSFYNCNFSGRKMLFIKNQSEANTFYSCRSEGGGISGSTDATIEVENATNLKFIGCYFENTMANLLKEIQSRNGVTFDDCHFTGSETGPWADFHFLSDGIINFINPYFGEANGIVSKFTLNGNLQNGFQKRTLGQHSTQILENSSHRTDFLITDKELTVNTNKLKIFSIKIPSDDVVAVNFKQISGKIKIDSYTLTNGGFPFSDSYEIDILLPYQSGYAINFHKQIKEIYHTLFTADVEIETNNDIVNVFVNMNYPTYLDIIKSLCTIKVELNKNTTTGYKDLEILI
ncbi:glycosyl hydrolase family 28-related protein [Chryseobacterium arachidis]|uniref:right-handed parallel beta-helix repeat-containing protein n=1 Tax=Chryseobacterium arachidis TaxID=1416778 RepID=UPI00362235EE